MIWLKLNVPGRSAPLSFLLDSGAGKSVVHLGTARQLGLTLGAREKVQGVHGTCVAYRVDRFAATVGGVAVPRAILALDLSPIHAGGGMHSDGILGADFFRERAIQIDFAAQKLRLLQRDELASCRGQVLPLVRRNDAFCVRASVDGNKAQVMRFDTGYSGALEWVPSGAQASRRSGTSVATTVSSRRQIQTEVLLGAERVAAVKTGVHPQPIFPGEAGLIGNELISKFHVTVDVPGSRLWLQRLAR